MKVVALTAPHRVEQVDDWPEPECGPGDVVVRMRAVGLCGSDLSLYDGERTPPRTPWILGHEGGGTIVAVGASVRDRHIGQSVVIEPNHPCDACAACEAGITSSCRRRRVLGMNAPGILAERVSVPARFAWPVPSSWPGEVLATIEPLAVARAAVRRSGIGAGRSALVVGAGSQGLFVTLALLEVGVEPHVTDPLEARVLTAEKLGAQRADLHQRHPYVFETAGPPEAFATAMHGVAATGTVTLIGLSGRPVELSTTDVVRRGLRIVGSIIYDHPSDFASTIAAVEGTDLHPERAVHVGLPPQDAAAAFAEARLTPSKSWLDLRSWWT